MGELRRPGQRAGAEPGEEEEDGLAGQEASFQAVANQQGYRQGNAEQVVVMQIRAGEGGENQYFGGVRPPPCPKNCAEGDGGLDGQGGMNAKKPDSGEDADEAAGKLRGLAGEEHVAHGGAGDSPECGPGGRAECPE